MPGRAASSVAADCGSASSQRRTTAASAAVVGSPLAGRLGDDQRGNQLVAAQGAVRGRAEQSGDAVNGVADAAQVRGQGVEQAGEVAAGGVGGVAGREMR